MLINEELFKTLNILYIEKNDELRNSFSQTLDKLFKKVFFSFDGIDAINQFTQQQKTDEKSFIFYFFRKKNIEVTELKTILYARYKEESGSYEKSHFNHMFIGFFCGIESGCGRA